MSRVVCPLGTSHHGKVCTELGLYGAGHCVTFSCSPVGNESTRRALGPRPHLAVRMNAQVQIAVGVCARSGLTMWPYTEPRLCLSPLLGWLMKDFWGSGIQERTGPG